MKYYFRTHYAKDLCLQYMHNKNVNDVFEYEWENKYGQWFITFTEFTRGTKSFVPGLEPTFMVIFTEAPEGTDIEVENVEDWVLFEYYQETIQFWKIKLDAVLIKDDVWKK